MLPLIYDISDVTQFSSKKKRGDAKWGDLGPFQGFI
jgi:hypothetical protein